MMQAGSLRRLTLPVAAIAAITAGTIVFVGSNSVHAAHAEAPEAAAAPAPAEATIEKAMREINDALKALGKGITADTRAAALDEFSKLETALIAAKGATPDAAGKVDEKKRAAFVNDYRKTLLDTLTLTCEAEKLVVDGKYKDADTMIRNKIGAMKSAGHSKFKPEGGGPGGK